MTQLYLPRSTLAPVSQMAVLISTGFKSSRLLDTMDYSLHRLGAGWRG
jgi:hypothetical protein